MPSGLLYDLSDPELNALLVNVRKLARRYNQIDEEQPEQREAVLQDLLPNTPYLPSLQAPVYLDYGCM